MSSNRSLLMIVLLALLGAWSCSNSVSPDPVPGPTVDIADYFPLENGRTWTYQGVHPEDCEQACTGPMTVCGLQVYAFCYDYFYMNEDGWYAVNHPYSCDPFKILPRQVGKGDNCAWGASGISWTCLDTHASVSVPAGTFDDCVKFKEVGVVGDQITSEKHFWLARGVGLVKEESVVAGGCDSGYLFTMDNVGGALTAELVSYTAPETGPCDLTPGDFLVHTRQGVAGVDTLGNTCIFVETEGPVEVRDGHIFVMEDCERIFEYSPDGSLVRTVTMPDEVYTGCGGHNMAALPGGGFAIIENCRNKVYFVDDYGDYVETVSMPNPDIGHAQNVESAIVDGFLVVSENGSQEIFRIDLSDHSSSILIDLTHLDGWLGAIAYDNGTYYICQCYKIYSYVLGQGEQLICELPEGCITGIVIVGDLAYASVNFSGEIYRVDLLTGEWSVAASGLDYTEDLEVWGQ